MPVAKRPIRKIACVGEVMIELIASDQNTAQLGVAGDTFNTAYYLNKILAEHGITTSYVTALGDDSFSDRIVKTIEGHGILSDTIERRSGMMPGLYAIETDSDGERSFSYWRSASAARSLFIEPCAVGLEQLNHFDLVLLTGITLAILPQKTRQQFLQWVDAFRQSGGTVAYDSNYRPALWEDIETAKHMNAQMWRRADIALPSVDDEMEMFGDRDEQAAFERLKSYGISNGVLKRGADGPLSLSTAKALSAPLAPVKVVDSTAAGDSFNAGYLAAICQNRGGEEAMEAGHRLAAHVVTKPGAIVDLQPVS